MPKFIDLTGLRFGRWRVIKRGLTRYTAKSSITRWECVCDCGSRVTVQAAHLSSGKSTNCGCAKIGKPLKHGAACGGHKKFSPEYRTWRSMRDRCLNSKNQDFRHYGGRGITICEQWGDFAVFLVDMGPRPSAGHSIDRIDGDGNYEPGNCRWATRPQQVASLPQNQRGYKHKTRHGISRIGATS